MRVLLTCPQAQSEELGSALEAHGIDWLGEPRLRIVPVPWDLAVLAGRPALLLTSANASRELIQVSGIRRDMPILAVRPDTVAPLRAAGFSDVHGRRRNRGEPHRHVRWHANSRAGRFLHLSGFDITLDLGTSLVPAGFVVDRMVVYRAVAVERMGARAMRAIAQDRFVSAVFLSARTAAVFCSLVIPAGLVGACARMTAIAVSRKIEEALRPAGFRRVVIAGSPNRRAVVDAIQQARNGDA